MTRFVVNGLGYEARLGGAGRPLLLLHGFTGSAATWAPHLRALWASQRTIAVDLLGHGRSDAPSDPGRHALPAQAADLAALLGRLDAIPADVIGYSMGARVALQLAVDHPAAVRRLVLESPSAGIADPAERARRRASDDELAAAIERDGVPAFVERWEALPIFASQSALPPAARRRLRRQRLANDAAGLAASLRGAGQGAMEPLHGRLGEVRAPTLVVAGRLDEAGTERAVAVAGAVRDARLEVVEGAGHTPHLEQPAAFRRIVVSFLAGGASLPDTPTH